MVDTCPSKPYDFGNIFSSTLEDKGYGGFKPVTAYGEKGKSSDEVINGCIKSRLRVRLTPEDDEFEKFNLMVSDMINWTYASGAPFIFGLSPNPLEMPCATVSLKILKAEDAMFSLRLLITWSHLEALWSAKTLLDTSFSDSSQALA